MVELKKKFLKTTYDMQIIKNYTRIFLTNGYHVNVKKNVRVGRQRKESSDTKKNCEES